MFTFVNGFVPIARAHGSCQNQPRRASSRKRTLASCPRSLCMLCRDCFRCPQMLAYPMRQGTSALDRFGRRKRLITSCVDAAIQQGSRSPSDWFHACVAAPKARIQVARSTIGFVPNERGATPQRRLLGGNPKGEPRFGRIAVLQIACC